MRKKYFFASAFFLALSNIGCVKENWDQYRLVESKPSSKNVFIPNVYIKPNKEIDDYFVIRLENHNAPHHLVLQFMDQSYLRKHEGFSSVSLEKLTITFADGTKIDCIHPESPNHLRGSVIPNNTLYNPNTIHYVIKKQMDFELFMSGVSTKSDGTPVPFELTEKYNYSRRVRIYPKLYDYLR